MQRDYQAPAIHCQCPREGFDQRVCKLLFSAPFHKDKILPWPVLATSTNMDTNSAGRPCLYHWVSGAGYGRAPGMSSPVSLGAWLMETIDENDAFRSDNRFSYQLYGRLGDGFTAISATIPSRWAPLSKKSASKKKNKAAEIEESRRFWFSIISFLLGHF